MKRKMVVRTILFLSLVVAGLALCLAGCASESASGVYAEATTDYVMTFTLQGSTGTYDINYRYMDIPGYYKCYVLRLPLYHEGQFDGNYVDIYLKKLVMDKEMPLGPNASPVNSQYYLCYDHSVVRPITDFSVIADGESFHLAFSYAENHKTEQTINGQRITGSTETLMYILSAENIGMLCASKAISLQYSDLAPVELARDQILKIKSFFGDTEKLDFAAMQAMETGK